MLSNRNQLFNIAREQSPAGCLIINADDWGRDSETTDRILECWSMGATSSVSAMVFMEDSERGADIARAQGVDAGLHLNLTTEFSSSSVPSTVRAHQNRLTKFLRSGRLASIFYHPFLKISFETVVAAQIEEFSRLYGGTPTRVDGHHHMHLCANVLASDLLPRRIIVRRNFSFQSGEKSFWNRRYRMMIDKVLSHRYVLTDYLFALPPLVTERLGRIRDCASRAFVELETHPVDPREFRFLTGGELFRWAEHLHIARGFAAKPSNKSTFALA